MTPRLARQFGPYKLLDRIASGGMAEVHRAWRPTADGDRAVVAIKVVLPHCNDDREFLEMMRDEARITGALRHPNIATTFEWGDVDDQHYLAMEFVDGVDLRAILSRCRKRGEHPPAEHILRIVIDALLGLYAAHVALDEQGRRLNIVHRDVSPSNVLVSFTGDVKVCDFGIAKAEFSQSRTRVGVVKGKVRYMSPEQTLGKKLDARSDVFAAGVLLYEALTLRAAFGAPTEAEMMERIRSFDLPPPSRIAPGVPPEADAVIQRALAKRKEARYQSARAFSDSLREVFDGRWPLSSRADLAEFIQGLFPERLEYSQRVMVEYEAGERVGASAATAIAAPPIPDEPAPAGDPQGGPAGIGRKVMGLFKSARGGEDTPRGAPVAPPDELDDAKTELRSMSAPPEEAPAAAHEHQAPDTDEVKTAVAAPVPPELA